MDGGVKPDNAGEIKESGASVLVAGSAIFNSKDYILEAEKCVKNFFNILSASYKKEIRISKILFI